MPISAIGAVGAPGVELARDAVTGAGYLDQSDAVSGSRVQGAGFSDVLSGAVTGLQAKQVQSSDLAVRAVTGDLNDIHDYTVAASEAKVALELTVAIRNKAVEAFNEVMRMQA